ncbi:MAG: glucosamine inositolphosphorylceramide transferase family protein [Gemmatimonadota bacterium]
MQPTPHPTDSLANDLASGARQPDSPAERATAPEAGSTRLGLIVDSFDQPRWIARALEEAVKSGVARITHVFAARSHLAGRSPKFIDSPLARTGRLIQDVYSRMDRWRPEAMLDPLERTSIRKLISRAALVEGVPAPDQLAARCDVVLWLIPPPRELDTGSVRHLEFSTDSGVSPRDVGFASVVSGRATCCVGIREISDPTMVSAAVSGVHPYSARRTAQNALWSAVPTLARALQTSAPAANTIDAPTINGSKRSRGALALARRYLRFRVDQARYDEQWALAFRRDPVTTSPLALFDGGPVVSEILPPPDRFWADPFVMNRDGVDWVFFEELLHERGLGRILVAPLGESGFAAEPVTVLERPFHLSYPFVLEHEGAVLMIPEMALEGRVEIFRATRFPWEWEQAAVILEGEMLVDSTLARIGDRWWLFATMADQCSDPSANLHLFHASSPYGPWEPHRHNPVRTDVRSSRPAGALFEYEGSWYRPAQDCSIRYGYAVQLQKIIRLDEEAYEEVPVSRLNPTWRKGLVGTHTVNRSGGLTVIDLQRRLPRERDK